MYYPKLKTKGVLDFNNLIEMLRTSRDFDPDSVIRYHRLIMDSLKSGYKVRLGALGSFVLGVHANKVLRNPADMKAEYIYVDRIRYKLDDDFVKEIRDAKIQIIIDNNLKMTQEERINNIILLFEKEAVINNQMVCEVNNTSSNVAGADLQYLVRKGVLMKQGSRKLATYCLTK